MRNPNITKELITSVFGEDFKYSCEESPSYEEEDPGWFHTIILGNVNIFIDEWVNNVEYTASIWIDDKRSFGISIKEDNPILILNNINKTLFPEKVRIEKINKVLKNN